VRHPKRLSDWNWSLATLVVDVRVWGVSQLSVKYREHSARSTPRARDTRKIGHEEVAVPFAM
jgi:hypothetical protein